MVFLLTDSLFVVLGYDAGYSDPYAQQQYGGYGAPQGGYGGGGYGGPQGYY